MKNNLNTIYINKNDKNVIVSQLLKDEHGDVIDPMNVPVKFIYTDGHNTYEAYYDIDTQTHHNTILYNGQFCILFKDFKFFSAGRLKRRITTKKTISPDTGDQFISETNEDLDSIIVLTDGKERCSHYCTQEGYSCIDSTEEYQFPCVEYNGGKSYYGNYQFPYQENTLAIIGSNTITGFPVAMNVNEMKISLLEDENVFIHGFLDELTGQDLTEFADKPVIVTLYPLEPADKFFLSMDVKAI